ncbi:MAG TPA: UDP-3-O-acyl-N-acetylglucosamine deacetylase [Rhizomicrobium sp.]
MTPRRTIAHEITVTGTALHAGVAVTMRLAPGAPGTGVVFHRSDLKADIAALYSHVGETRLGTVLEQDGARVGVVEHLMAAAAGLEIDDLRVELDGPEPPILDGDALSYLTLLESGGLKEQDRARSVIRVLKPVTVEQGDAKAALLPAEALSYSYELSFPVIGEQYYAFAFSRAGFKAEIAPARTFGFLKELAALNAMNLARGATLANTLALDDGGVVNKDVQRFADEFVRHKILDAIGDMALAGAPLLARFEGRKSGHATNNALLRALFSDSANYEMVAEN